MVDNVIKSMIPTIFEEAKVKREEIKQRKLEK